MIKLKRSNKNYGSGSGFQMFESKLFRVVLWKHQNGIKTTIEIKPSNKEIHFDGKHIIKSDKSCFDQISIPEIKEIIKGCEKKAFKAGKNEKVDEIKKCLDFDWY